jgi:hypothetical protein
MQFLQKQKLKLVYDVKMNEKSALNGILLDKFYILGSD